MGSSTGFSSAVEITNIFDKVLLKKASEKMMTVLLSYKQEIAYLSQKNKLLEIGNQIELENQKKCLEVYFQRKMDNLVQGESIKVLELQDEINILRKNSQIFEEKRLLEVSKLQSE